MDFKKNLKISLSSVGKMYVVCAILRNALTCLYPNQTSQYFNLDPPTYKITLLESNSNNIPVIKGECYANAILKVSCV